MSQCKLIADVTILSGGKVMLVKYKDGNIYDHQNGWFLPDDLVKEFENPDDAAKRILKEQLDIQGSEVKISFVESFTGNDKSWHIVFHYKTNIRPEQNPSQSEDIMAMEFFDLKNLPEKNDIAHHGWALYTLDETSK